MANKKNRLRNWLIGIFVIVSVGYCMSKLGAPDADPAAQAEKVQAQVQRVRQADPDSIAAEVNALKPREYLNMDTLVAARLKLIEYAAVSAVLESTDSTGRTAALKKAITQAKIRMYPHFRKEYARIAGDVLWRENIEVAVSGSKAETITFVGGIFASNAQKQDFYTGVRDALEAYRFKRANFKWIPSEDRYTYWEIQSKKDTE